jgi:pyruvate/2-oxoglutarate dehydrogenase complex dihydrolipoamide acyltransferase (E2) component
MRTAIVPMPKVGEISDGGTVLKWLVSTGTTVQAGDLLVEVMTDKVNYEVEAPYSGVVTKLLAQPGEDIPNGGPLCEMELNT